MDQADLESSPEDTANAFAAQAIRKAELADNYLALANRFAEDLEKAESSIHSLIENEDLRQQLLTAIGLSDKAKKYFTPESEREHLEEILDLLQSRSKDLKRELVYRFLLTSGDSLGGRSRNMIGREGSDRLIENIQKLLLSRHQDFDLMKTKEEKIAAIIWEDRVVMFDIKPRWINKNIDVILFKTTSSASLANLREDPEKFLACGEIKGGADPAGSDEHWKTAKSALERIREAFESLDKTPPPLFFAGLSIVPGVAQEIAQDLRRGKLTRAANLARDEQLNELSNWLVGL